MPILLECADDVISWFAGSTFKDHAHYHDGGDLHPRALEAALDRIGGSRYGVKGAKPDRPGSYCIQGRWIHPASKWVSTHSGAVPEKRGAAFVSDKLNEIHEAALDEGLAVGRDHLPSPGSIAKNLLLRRTGYLGADPPGVGGLRTMGRLGVHQGPMIACVAYAPRSHLYDRVGAFLGDPKRSDGLYTQIPLGWRAVCGEVAGTSTDIKTCLDLAAPFIDRAVAGEGLHGLIDAEVWVEPGLMVPTLPCSTRHGAMYATGMIRNIWPLCSLAQELRAGRVVLARVWSLIVATRQRAIYSPVADIIAAIKLKDLRKGLYLTAWGSLLAGDSFLLSPDKSEGAKRAFFSSWWITRQKGPTDTDENVSKIYRPSHAAFIAGSNADEVARAVWAVEKDGGYIHSILTDSIAASKPVNRKGWKEECTGELRQYGVGSYVFADGAHLLRRRAMGCQDQCDPGALARHYEQASGHERARRWFGDPSLDVSAYSMPHELTERAWWDLYAYDDYKDARDHAAGRVVALP